MLPDFSKLIRGIYTISKGFSVETIATLLYPPLGCGKI